MQPRKPTSTKRVKQDLPKDSIKLISELIEKNFPALIKTHKTVAQGELYPDEILLLIGFRALDGISQSNFSASVNHDIKKKNTMNQIYLAIDALGSMIQQFSEAEGDIELPMEWTEFSLEGQKVFMKFDKTNTDLEAQADTLLGKN